MIPAIASNNVSNIILQGPQAHQAPMKPLSPTVSAEGPSLEPIRRRRRHRFWVRLRPSYWTRSRRRREYKHAKPRTRDRIRATTATHSILCLVIGRRHASVIHPMIEESARMPRVEVQDSRLSSKWQAFRRGLSAQFQEHNMRHRRHSTASAEFATSDDKNTRQKHHKEDAYRHVDRTVRQIEEHIRGRRRYANEDDRGQADERQQHVEANGHVYMPRHDEDIRAHAERHLRTARMRLEESRERRRTRSASEAYHFGHHHFGHHHREHARKVLAKEVDKVAAKLTEHKVEKAANKGEMEMDTDIDNVSVGAKQGPVEV